MIGVGKRHFTGAVPCRLGIGLTLSLSVAACSSDVQRVTGPITSKVSAAAVTGAAAAALRSDGSFALPDALIHPNGELSADEAVAIAREYVRNFGPSYVQLWASAHGAAIDLNALAPCTTALYARSAYKSVGANISEITRRQFGPHWIVALCQREVPAVILTFSSLATDLRNSTPKEKQQAYAQTDFLSHGYPLSADASMFTPEGVVSRAFERTGKRITTIPELILPPMPDSPALVRWRVTFDGPVSIKSASNSSPRNRSALFAGFLRVFIASGLLDGVPTSSPVTDSWTDGVTKAPFSPVLADDVPAKVEMVTVTP